MNFIFSDYVWVLDNLVPRDHVLELTLNHHLLVFRQHHLAESLNLARRLDQMNDIETIAHQLLFGPLEELVSLVEASDRQVTIGLLVFASCPLQFSHELLVAVRFRQAADVVLKPGHGRDVLDQLAVVEAVSRCQHLIDLADQTVSQLEEGLVSG